MKDRDKRVAELMRSILSEILMELDFYVRGLFTITNVLVTKDLKTAKIFYSVGDEEREAIEKKIALYRRQIRYKMGSRLKLRYVPEICFVYDDGIKKFNSVMELFKKIENEKPA